MLLEGREITTVEGLGTIEEPGPMQAAFIEEQAAQCGYCIPGMMMRAQALLQKNPAPSDAEIRAALEPNLCRCGTHMRILKAVQRAGELMQSAGAGRARGGPADDSALDTIPRLPPQRARRDAARWSSASRCRRALRAGSRAGGRPRRRSRRSCRAASTTRASSIPGSASTPTARSPSSPARPSSARASGRR